MPTNYTLKAEPGSFVTKGSDVQLVLVQKAADLNAQAAAANNAAEIAATSLENFDAESPIERIEKISALAQIRSANAFGASVTAAAATLESSLRSLETKTDTQARRLATWTMWLFIATALLAFGTIGLFLTELARVVDEPAIVVVQSPK
jgi:hypothetical protein